MGVFRPVLQTLTRSKTKNVIFHTCFQTRPLKAIPVFRPGLKGEIMLSLLRLGRKQKNSSNPFRIRIFIFLSHSFGIETINTFKHSRSSLENHTRFQTKCVHPFSDQNGAKPLPDGGRTYLYGLYKGVPPGIMLT